MTLAAGSDFHEALTRTNPSSLEGRRLAQVIGKDLDVARRVAPAFLEDLFYRALFQALAPTSRLDLMATYLALSAREADAMGSLTVAPERTAMAAWLKPRDAGITAQESADKLAFIEAALGVAASDRYASVAAFMHGRAAACVPSGAWYLSIVAVSPDAQGQGLGGRVLAPTLAEADRAGAPSYLETFAPRTIGFYRRLGFEVAATTFEPTVVAAYTVMVRLAEGRGVGARST